MESSKQWKGLVVKAQSGIFDVKTERGVFPARLRGRLTQGPMESDAIAVGDRVRVTLLEDGNAAIEDVEPRERVLSRSAPGREDIEQVIVANPDQIVIVFACADPDPNFRMLDRFLVVSEREHVPAVICANKIDLVVPRSARREFGLYKDLGYPVLFTSATSGKGIRKLRKILHQKLSVFTGPSGVGKTSLLNRIEPGLGLHTEEVRSIGKGRHTTVVPELVPLKRGGYVADTPGLKAFALWDIEPEEVDGYFREIRPLVVHCEFSDCTHIHEPGCAVIAAVEQGEVAPERYDSYLRIREGQEVDPW